jgi:hypothetical protein
MEDNLNLSKMEDNLNFFKDGRRPQILREWKTTLIFGKTCLKLEDHSFLLVKPDLLYDSAMAEPKHKERTSSL